MAYLFTTGNTRTEIAPANGKAFTEGELKGIVGGPLDILELPGNLYAVCVHNAKEIGAELNAMAMAGHQIHVAHCKSDGTAKTELPEIEFFYGDVIFCKAEELNGNGHEDSAQPAYTGQGDGNAADPNEGGSKQI